MLGLDEIGSTLERIAEIEAFERQLSLLDTCPRVSLLEGSQDGPAHIVIQVAKTTATNSAAHPLNLMFK